MATTDGSLTISAAAGAGHSRPSAFKCRRCRQFLFGGDSVLPSPSPGQPDPAGAGSAALWYVADETQPAWIQRAVEEVCGTEASQSCMT